MGIVSFHSTLTIIKNHENKAPKSIQHLHVKMDGGAKKRNIECKPEMVISSLQKFYTLHPEIDKVITYLNGEAPLSLRIIDWFVTNYAKKHNLVINRDGNRKPFIVFLEYKSQLKAYSKKQLSSNTQQTKRNRCTTSSGAQLSTNF
jgi:hypothetical protein